MVKIVINNPPPDQKQVSVEPIKASVEPIRAGLSPMNESGLQIEIVPDNKYMTVKQ